MAITRQTRKNASRTHGVRWAVAGIAAAVLVADQVTKSLVVAGGIPSSFSSSWLSVGLGSNHGATASVASGSPLLVTLAALALTALAAVLAVRSTNRAAALCLAAVVGTRIRPGPPATAAQPRVTNCLRSRVSLHTARTLHTSRT
jgi:lipoprotein signal peptidase